MDGNPNWHEETANAVDEQWLNAISKNWQELTGLCWVDLGGETREEALQANVVDLFRRLLEK